ncbi:HigA family addiction module antitoxin [Corynebacterium sphenisci]|uniref:HigA family addiction module antitoxin n=1 Tax=Corynebacterium sphenisci TaxID=191493 RepID=UPI0026DEB84E|nr:HigA family addiction module antitoxin [Corynebacterium sphenisci]MDO5730043.1 HigA family addiction module antitoxin [Corynebacterium sphenisci]
MFEDGERRRLAIQPGTRTRRWPDEATRRYRRRIQQIRAARDERGLRAIRSLNLEKLKGDRAGRCPIRINRKYRLILKSGTRDDGRVAIIIDGLDHRGREETMDINVAEVFPPGEFIEEELAERGWPQETLAEIMGVDRQIVSDAIGGRRRISIRTARRLGAAFGTSAEYWLNPQNLYELHVEGRSASDEQLSDVRRRAHLNELAPISAPPAAWAPAGGAAHRHRGRSLPSIRDGLHPR